MPSSLIVEKGYAWLNWAWTSPVQRTVKLVWPTEGSGTTLFQLKLIVGSTRVSTGVRPLKLKLFPW